MLRLGVDHPRYDIEVMSTALGQFFGRKSYRHPEADVAVQKLKACRHYSHNCVLLAIEQKLATDDAAFTP